MRAILGFPRSPAARSPRAGGQPLESRAMPPPRTSPRDDDGAAPLIATDEGLAELAGRLAGVPTLGIDCEMDAMYAYRTSLCLVQLGWGEGDGRGEALVDAMEPLDWSILQPVLADDGVVKILHGGENDIGLMSAHWGLRFENIFDTSAAAQVVGRERVGLAALLKEHFGVEASKQHQRADWRVRPLPGELVEYALEDVRHLIPLYRILRTELEELGRVEEARSEFDRIRSARFEDKPFDPDSWVRVKGARELPVRRRGVLAEVFAVRDAIAERMDRAPYRVARDHALHEMARRMPRQIDQLRRIKGVARDLPGDDLAAMLDAVERGAKQHDRDLPPAPRRGNRAPLGTLTPEQQQLFDALRHWRSARAKKRGVIVARVATNALLTAIARARPETEEQLAAVEGMEPWRMREYAEEMLTVIRSQEPC